MSEIDRINNGYWSFLPSGIPLPAFLNNLLNEDRYRKRFYFRMSQFQSRQTIVPFALEAEHQASPIDTLHALGKALERIARVDYDLTKARQIEATWLQAWDAINASRDAKSRDELKLITQRSAANRLQMELKYKNLPDGMAANMEIIRQLVSKKNDVADD